jgi:hypothetical protein
MKFLEDYGGMYFICLLMESVMRNKIPDVRELLDDMEKDPLLRHKILLHYYEYKKKEANDKDQTRQSLLPPAAKTLFEKRVLDSQKLFIILIEFSRKL